MSSSRGSSASPASRAWTWAAGASRGLKGQLPPDMKLAFFYDQSILVRDSVRSVWEAIIFGLILSVAILFVFLKDWGSTLVAIVVIPVTVLVTLLAMRLMNMTF